MALPRQVQKQIKETEELEKQLAQGEDQQEEMKADEVTEDTEVKVTEAKAEEDVSTGIEAKPADETKGEEATDDFKQKYSTLKGKYDAEVPRLHQQIKDLTAQMQSFKDDIEAKKKAEAEKPKEKVSYITDADREEYGDDLLDVQRRVAKEVAQEYDDKLDAQAKIIEALQKQISDTGGQVGEIGFSSRLRQLVPDFDQIDGDDRWAAWLNEYDPMLNSQRRDVAQKAFDSGDAESVAHYVKLFKKTLVADEPVVDTRQAELEKQVTPGRNATTQAKSNGKSAKIYSSREMDNQWSKIKTMSTKGMYDEAAKLEAELTAAYVEGRVRA